MWVGDSARLLAELDEAAERVDLLHLLDRLGDVGLDQARDRAQLAPVESAEKGDKAPEYMFVALFTVVGIYAALQRLHRRLMIVLKPAKAKRA